MNNSGTAHAGTDFESHKRNSRNKRSSKRNSNQYFFKDSKKNNEVPPNLCGTHQNVNQQNQKRRDNMKIQMNEYFPNSAHNIQTMPIYSSPASNEGMLSPVMEFANSMTPPTHTAPPAGDQMMMNPNQVITYSAPGQWIQQTTLLPNQSTLPVQHYHMAPATINSPPFYPHSISNPNAMSYMHSCGDSLPPQKSMSVPAMQSYKMEQRRQQSLIQIVNPNTGEDISKEILTNRMDEDLQELDSFRDNQINLLAKVTETTTTHESQNPVPGVMVPYLIHPIHLQEVNPVQQIMFESHIPLSHTSENIQEQSTTQTQIEMFDEEQEKPINCNNGNISVQTVIGTVKEDPVHRPALPQSENMMKTVSTENQSTQESSEMLPNKIVDSVEEFVPQNTVENETLAPEEVNSVQRHNQVSIVYPVLNKCHSKMSQTNAMDTSTAAQAAQARTENHPIESNSVEQPFQVGLPSYAEMTQHQIPSMTPLQVTQVQTPLLPAVSDPNQLQTRQPVVAYLPVVFYLEGTIPNGDPIAGPRSFQGSAHPQPLSAHGAKPTQGIQVDI